MKLEYCLLDYDDFSSGLPPASRWQSIDADSTAQAQSTVDRMISGDVTGAIIARRNSRGGLNVLVARNQATYWTEIAGSDVYLARYFFAKLDERPRSDGDTLRPWGFSIDDPEVFRNVVGLIGADVGMNATRQQVIAAALRLNSPLRALGVPTGNWSIEPCILAFEKAQSAHGNLAKPAA